MARGGKRLGAGRPKGSGKYGEETKAVRLPVSQLENLPELLNRLRAIQEHPESERVPDRVEQFKPESRTIAKNVYAPDFSTKRKLPLYMNPVAAGLPALTEDYIEGRIDLNKHLVKHPDDTFIVRVTGESMIDAGIHPGDFLIVDRAIEVISGKVVIAVVDGELTVKRMSRSQNKLALLPANDNFQPIPINAETDLHVWGVVTNVIHPL
jgi:DNA polymerase V